MLLQLKRPFIFTCVLGFSCHRIICEGPSSSQIKYIMCYDCWLLGVVLEMVVFVLTGVDVLATEMFTGSESES